MGRLKNEKHERFCQEYAKSLNATESYKKSGFKSKNEESIRRMGSKLLSRVDIKQRIRELTEPLDNKAIADIQEIQEMLTKTMRGEMTEDRVVVEGCGDGISEAKIVKTEIQPKDRLKAAETLAKMQGGFDNRVNVTMTVPIFDGDEELED